MPNPYLLAATVDFALKLLEIATHWQKLPLGGTDGNQIALLFGTAFVAQELKKLF